MKLFSVLRYVKGYWGYAGLNIFFNILFSVFSVVSLALVIPFMDLLFKSGTADYLAMLNAGKPTFDITHAVEYIKATFNYTMANLIVSSGKIEALFFICVVVFALTLFKNIFRYFAMYFLAPIRNGVVRDLRNKLVGKALYLPLSYYSNERKGDIMSRMTSDVQEIEWSIMQTLELIFREPLQIVISLAIMISISPSLTLYVFLLLPVAALIVAVIGKSLKRSAVRSKEVLGRLFNIMEETLGGLKVIKAFTGERYVQRKFSETNEEFYRQSVSMYRKTDLTSPVSETVVVGILMLILFIGGKMVISNDAALSAAAFIGYFAMASQIVPPIKQITQAYNNIQKGIASEERINKILHAESDIKEPASPTEIKTLLNQVEFRNVSFAYTKGDSGYVLKDINLVIPKGRTVALVGQSGSGKTTMCDMIARFYDADAGEILFDNLNIRNTSLKSLRNMLGMVSQEPVLFNDTVFNNIAFGLENVSEQQVIEAARIANAHDFIVAMPQGYHTNIGDRGAKLSGGQRQRISIARAVLKNPPILILDEATSALDSENERLVQDALQKLMKDRTTVVIAHRLSTIVNAEEIVVLEKGKIIERGTHKQLLEKQGAYHKLYEMQALK